MTRSSSNVAGSALLPTVVVSLLVAGLAGAVVSMVHSGTRENQAQSHLLMAQYVAESGAKLAIEDLRNAGSGVLGSEQDPRPLGSGSFFTLVQDIGSQLFVVNCQATVGTMTVSVECTVRGETPMFHNALSAGNSSGDPTYALDLGGSGAQRDEVIGDVYSGGDFQLSGDAEVNGDVRAAGAIHGTTGTEGQAQAIPDVGAMDYANHHDIDVASLFDLHSTYTSDDAGGSAYQLPEEQPAHIFRKNPSDRQTEIDGTAKDDYFLEDPYEPVRTDRNQNGSDAYQISLSGTAGEPGVDSNRKVFFIDGNLWVHNRKSYSLKFKTSADQAGLQVTFVVRGNIYLSDNLFYTNVNKDAVAFIAIEDETVADSGNIYFGDPVYGTLQRMESLMYAENNFYDTNLDASGSSEVELFGVMSAGNQVLVNRDFGDSHTKLSVEFDDRLQTGALELPGLPGTATGRQEYTVVGWRTMGETITP